MTKARDAHQRLTRTKSIPLLVLFTVGLALFGIGFWGLYLTSQTHMAKPSSLKLHSAVPVTDGRQEPDRRLETLIEELSSPDEDTRIAAKKDLIHFARQSEANRKTVIDKLLGRAEMPAFRSKLATVAGSYFWTSISEIFDELKALEALDFLVDCIDCTAITGHASDSYHHKPAVRALIGFGDLAVPKLSTLLYRPESQIRFYAAVCLGNIRTSDSRRALSQAVTGEADPRVRAEMQGSIDTIDRAKFEGRRP